MLLAMIKQNGKAAMELYFFAQVAHDPHSLSYRKGFLFTSWMILARLNVMSVLNAFSVFPVQECNGSLCD